jgi:hypothetical protein
MVQFVHVANMVGGLVHSELLSLAFLRIALADPDSIISQSPRFSINDNLYSPPANYPTLLQSGGDGAAGVAAGLLAGRRVAAL